MGVYLRKYRKTGRKIWWISYTYNRQQIWESSHSTSKRVAERLLAMRQAEVAESRYNLVRTNPPYLEAWSVKYLESISNLNTRKRYHCSHRCLISFFGKAAELSSINVAQINEFKRRRRKDGVKTGSLNRDLRYLAQILKQAERERLIGRSPFDFARFFERELDRGRPHILTWEEQERLLSVASPRLRMLIVLGTETGMRTGEMLSLRWEDVDLASQILQVKASKTQSGIRAVPISALCKSELLRWRDLVGADYSEWVFPRFENRRDKLQCAGRKSWANALKKAGIEFFPIYYLRHCHATRLTTAGVSPLTIAAMLGHSSTQIVPRYAQVMDQNRLEAIKRLDALREVGASHIR